MKPITLILIALFLSATAAAHICPGETTAPCFAADDPPVMCEDERICEMSDQG